MATYKEIFGKQVKNLSSDPANDAEGQIWFNTTSGTFKSLVQIKAWSSGGNMALARRESGAAGTQTASVVFGGGLAPSGNPDSNATEEYNGATYTTSGNLNAAREGMGAAGTQTAALGFGGATYPSPGVRNVTEGYNGSTWTSLNNLNANRSYVAGFGTQTAALAVGGAPDSPVNLQTESWDGTNWTNLSSPSNVPVGMLTGASAGTQTAGLIFGGANVNDSPPGAQSTTIDWNGSAWTAGNNMNTARRRLGGAGTSTAALGFGGYLPSPYSAATEEYDGSTWTTSSASLPTATGMMHGSGSMNAALSSGGRTSTAFTGATHEYNSNINAITQAVWSSGGVVNTVGDVTGGAGTLNAGLKFGGYPPSGGGTGTTATEEYNGSSWTSVNNMNTAGYGLTGTGLQTAAVRFGGYSGGALNNAEEYDGTNWTAVTVVPTVRESLTSFGVQTAAVLAGGYNGTAWLQTALEYDGTNYSSGGTMPSTTGAQYSGSAGTQTAGLYFGGYIPGSALGVTTASYNGSSWSAENNMLISRYTSGSGTQTAALAPGGYQNPNSLNPTAGNSLACEQYDGTNWSNTCNNNITRGYQISSNRASNAPGTTGLVFGGSNSPSSGNTNTSEEFTGGTEVVTASTLTTS